MNKDDRDWLEKVFSEFTMNEAKEMKEAIDVLLNHKTESDDNL